ncbi:MAG TPA: tRNA pseudouridine(38-40) synthase TruA, partial [Patescibacteria group bacterium]|nr:tRNA pseudouridine(38-40) synthase TruA [Patescibacteria group bacterium]
LGTAYHGWQIQPGVPTIQGVLQEKLATILRQPVVAAGAARTDAGVHALGQVASLMVRSELDPGRLRRSMNSVLPEDVSIRSVEIVGDAFHARHSARGRIYRYQIAQGEYLSPFLRGFAAYCRTQLDVEAMSAAAGKLVGRKDFSSFKAAGDVSDSPIKEIRRSSIERAGDQQELIVYTVEASSFLQHMVRNIAGTLIEVGRGRIDPEQIESLLEARDRRVAGPTAPASGLCLMKVLYPDLAPDRSGW